jgi:hypothetical protein
VTFLAPVFLFASLAGAAAIVALHFIVTRQPRSSILPTARFVPDTRATTIAPAKRPSDLLVMLLRVVTVLAVGVALAKPVLLRARRPNARVVVVDASRSARDSIAVRDSARAVYRDGDAVVVFDSAARVLAGNIGDSIAHVSPGGKRGNLSAALIAAVRAGSSLRDRADSLELVIVSPFAREELDAATDSIRSLWQGKARLVRAGTDNGGNGQTDAPGKIVINAEADDPLAVTVGFVRPSAGTNAVIERVNSAASLTTAGGVLIDWPATNRPRGAVSRSRADTVSGITTAPARVIAPFERRWTFPTDSLRGADVIARWADGEPAAIERPADSGCMRSVAIPVASVGDLAIRHDFVRLVASISRPCARVTATIPADPSDVARLVRSGGLAPRAAFQSPTDTRSTLAPWLLALALATAITELFVRRSAREATLAANKLSSLEERAA